MSAARTAGAFFERRQQRDFMSRLPDFLSHADGGDFYLTPGKASFHGATRNRRDSLPRAPLKNVLF